MIIYNQDFSQIPSRLGLYVWISFVPTHQPAAQPKTKLTYISSPTAAYVDYELCQPVLFFLHIPQH